MDPKITGEFIKGLRTEANLTQKELSEKLNCTDKAVSRWETGKGFPDVSYLIELSDILNVNVNELLIGRRIKDNENKKANDKILVDTISYGNNKIKTLKIIASALFCLLLLLVFYLPIATMSPSDTMGVIFFHILAGSIISFLFGFTNIKLKWFFPAFSFVAYCPVAVLFNSLDLLIYAALLLLIGYMLILIATLIVKATNKLLKRDV